MQQNATRPVMDVARRSSSIQTSRMPVRPAPGRAQNTKPQPLSEPRTKSSSPTSGVQAGISKPEPHKESQIPVKSSAPVGIIVVALLSMMVLIALAVIIYLTA